MCIFSSVTHLGSSPAMIDLLFCPTTIRDTYKKHKRDRILHHNHITRHNSRRTPYSANYDDTVSEFDKTNLEAEFKDGINIPL
jgi:hypothetical protein